MVDDSLFLNVLHGEEGDSEATVLGSPMFQTMPAISVPPSCGLDGINAKGCGGSEASEMCGDNCDLDSDIYAESDTSIVHTKTIAALAATPVAMSPVAVSSPQVEGEVVGVPLDEGVEVLSPELIEGLVRDGTCLLIDVRGDDRASGLIPGAIHVPAISIQNPFVVKLPELVEQHRNTRLVVFFCQFCKHRAPFCANLFRDKTNEADNTLQRVAIMEGGFRAWQKLGLPVQGEGGATAQALADSIARRQGGMLMQRA